MNLLDGDELVPAGADADALGVLEAELPVGVGVQDVERCSCGWVFSNLLPGRAGAAITMSAQAWSRATGSKEAAMPRSGTMAASLWFQQSHSGDTLTIRLI